MKILITGIAGFIGFHLARKLSKDGFEIVGIDNLNEYYDVNYKLLRLKELGICKVNNRRINYKSKSYENLYFSKIDINENEAVYRLFKKHKPEIVIHLAAQAGVRYSISNPDEYIETNILGFYNIINAARLYNIKNFFYASSSSVYGDSSKLPFNENENVDQPVSLYAASKKANELIAHSFSNIYNLKCVGLRFFTVYGPFGRPDMAYFDFTNSIFNEKAIKVFNNGNLTRDFTYIDDIIESISRLVVLYTQTHVENLNYEIFNIGNSDPIKLLDFIKTIENCIEKKAKLEFIDMQEGDVHNTYSDSSKLYSKIGFIPKTKLKDGIINFINWFIEVHKKSENVLK